MTKKSILKKLKERAILAPQKPGVYLFKNAQKQIIYIGKAKDLKKRLSSYFLKNRSEKAKWIVAKSNDLEILVVNSEVEALILESNLVKKHQPRYNVELKDDKNFLYLKIPIQDDFPVVSLVRQPKDDSAKYFGPYTDAKELRLTLKSIRRIFPYRNCGLKVKEGIKQKPCLDFHLGLCLTPCLGNVSAKDYHKMIDDFILFLEGKQTEIMEKLEQEMNEKVAAKDFEKAAQVRDEIKGIKKITAKQKVISQDFKNQDFIGLARGKELAMVNLFLVRNGKLIGSEYFTLKNVAFALDDEILGSFMENYYKKVFNFPEEIIVSVKPNQSEILIKWLNQISKQKIKIIPAQKGQKKSLLNLANENAELHLKEIARMKKINERFVLEKGLQELLEVIQYSKLFMGKKEIEIAKIKHFRIEGYDISNLQGKQAYGSMVVLEIFEKLIEDKDKAKRELKWLTRLAKDQYRIFKIRQSGKPNDYQMLREVLLRRFGNVKKHLADESFQTFPDLILIDGGKGQLNTILKILKELRIDLPVISLVKKEEIIFSKLNQEGIKLAEASSALKLLQRVRDESHRFSLKFHHDLRSKEITQL